MADERTAVITVEVRYRIIHPLPGTALYWIRVGRMISIGVVAFGRAWDLRIR